MKKAWKYFVAVVLPVSGLSALFAACSTAPCNNDACYDRNLSSADPYKQGDIAAWGSEKQIAEQEDERDARAEMKMNRPVRNRER
ncbi:MAG: hypothetical protein AB7K68_06870 [Bacteriovoracia bacterium]